MGRLEALRCPVLGSALISAVTINGAKLLHQHVQERHASVELDLTGNVK